MQSNFGEILQNLVFSNLGRETIPRVGCITLLSIVLQTLIQFYPGKTKKKALSSLIVSLSRISSNSRCD